MSDNLVVNIEQITTSSSFTQDLGADSLDKIQLKKCFEASFNISTNDSDCEKLLTVGDVINYISKNLNKL